MYENMHPLLDNFFAENLHRMAEDAHPELEAWFEALSPEDQAREEDLHALLSRLANVQTPTNMIYLINVQMECEKWVPWSPPADEESHSEENQS